MAEKVVAPSHSWKKSMSLLEGERPLAHEEAVMTLYMKGSYSEGYAETVHDNFAQASSIQE